jgi:hypothetical protein
MGKRQAVDFPLASGLSGANNNTIGWEPTS